MLIQAIHSRNDISAAGPQAFGGRHTIDGHREGIHNDTPTGSGSSISTMNLAEGAKFS